MSIRVRIGNGVNSYSETPMDLLHYEAFSFMLSCDNGDQTDFFNSNIEHAINLFRLLRASGVDWSEGQLRWMGMLVSAQNFFEPAQMAPAIDIVEFFSKLLTLTLIGTMSWETVFLPLLRVLELFLPLSVIQSPGMYIILKHF